MADTKITALAPIGAIDPANDVLPIVDVSNNSMAASGTTCRVTTNQLLQANAIASLASATISGDLTVDTSTLKVDSANNRVGVGTVTPAAALEINLPEVSSAAGTSAIIYNNTGGGNRIAALRLANLSNQWNIRAYGAVTDDLRFGSGAAGSEVDYLSIGNTGIFTWSNVGGGSGTAMTLNATGLGVGGAPVNPLTVFAAASAKAPALLLSTAGSPTYGWDFSVDGAVNGNLFIRSLIGGTKTDVLEFDRATGNLGIGLTPSASHILSCAGPIGIFGTNSGTRTSYISNSDACAIYYTDGGGSGYFVDYGNLIIQPRTSAARSVVIATGTTTPVERAVVKSTGQVRFVPLASDPAGAEAGDVYYNSTSNKLKCYNGTTWNDLF